MTRFAPKYVRTLFVLALMLFGASVRSAEATHFLGGTIRWQRDLTYVDPNNNRYFIYFNANWRWSFAWQVPSPGVGQVFDPGAYSLVITGAGFNQAFALPQTAIAINPVEDWLTGQSQLTLIIPKTALPVTLNFESGDRSSALAEGNHDSSFRLRTVIPNATAASSPGSTMLPRVYLQQGAPVAIQMPTTVASGGVTNTFAIAPIEDSLLRIARPMGIALCSTAGTIPIAQCQACFNNVGGVCDQGMSISNSGLITWTPQVAGLYAVQFKISSRDAAGNIVASTPFDMVFSVLASCPTCGSVHVASPPSVNATVGVPMSFPVNSSVSNFPVGRYPQLASTPLPAGATLAPLVPNPPAPTLLSTFNWTPPVGSQGDYPICFQATEPVSLTTSLGQACTTVHVLSNVPAAVTCPAVPNTPAVSISGASVTLQGTVLDPEARVTNFTLVRLGSPNQTLIPNTTVPVNTTTPFQYSFTGNFPIGTTAVQLTANDGFNTSSCTFNVVVDRLTQTIDFVTPTNVSYPNAIPFTATATSSLPVLVEVVSGPAGIVGPGLIPVTGVGTVELRASQGGDAFYAPATIVNALISVNDTTPPAIAPHGPETAEATGPNGAILHYASPGFTDDISAAGTATCLPASGSVFALGATQVDCHAQDGAGNGSDSHFVVTITDTTAPTIGTNPDISTPSTSPAGATVNFAPPAASDIVDGLVPVVCVPASGSTFGQGMTQVTCTATDAHGNHASSVFTVSVTNSAPIVTVPPNITAEATSAGGAIVNFNATAFDNEQGAITPTCVPAAGLFPIGTTPVTCTATDVANATGSASFTVTVQDTTAPVVTYSGNAGSYTIGQTINITCSATDAVGVVSNTCANISGPGYTFAATNTYSASATDAAGNIGSATTTFTVVTTLQGLEDLVNSFCNNPGVCQGLNAKLTAAANAPNLNARKGQLGAFENQVAAQTGKCMTAQQAAILLQLVRAFFN